MSRQFNLDQKHGVEVMGVESGGPADDAGIQEGDVLLALGDQPATSVDDLHKLLTELETAFNGTPHALIEGVQTMIELRYQAIALMHVPLDDDAGRTAGPAFQWRSPSGN